MSEFYCPNCNADLGEQYGFDPDNGHWTCTECGQFLTDPNDSGSVMYEGVGWFCDKCGAYLNKQIGFTDLFDTWTCTECGHINGTTEDDIYPSEEDYQRAKEEDDGYGYDVEWRYSNPKRCELCNRLLNIQSGYYDWSSSHICEHCGHFNDLEENDDDEVDEDDVDIDNDDSDESSGDSDFNGTYESEDSPYKAEYEELVRQNDYKRLLRKEKKKEFRRRHWKAYLVGFVLLVIGCFVGYKVFEYKSLRIIPFSSDDYNQMSVEEVETLLKEAGFLFISTDRIPDLDYAQRNTAEKVETITINAKDTFEADSRFPLYSRIKIQYHTMKEINVPASAKELKGRNHQDVLKLFQEAGFGDIQTEKIEDLVTGWITKDGEVESVTINGEAKYQSNKVFPADASILIKYHTFKE